MEASAFDGLVSISARTKAVAVVRKQKVEDRRELLQRCLLDQAMHDTGNVQLSCPRPWVWDVDGAYTLRVVLTASNLTLRVGQYCFT